MFYKVLHQSKTLGTTSLLKACVKADNAAACSSGNESYLGLKMGLAISRDVAQRTREDILVWLERRREDPQTRGPEDPSQVRGPPRGKMKEDRNRNRK